MRRRLGGLPLDICNFDKLSCKNDKKMLDEIFKVGVTRGDTFKI